MSKTIELERKVVTRGEELSQDLHKMFREKGVFVVNLIGSPGSGKTSLLEAMAPDLAGKAAVIEGDIQTEEDKLRIERAGLPAYQIETLGACHLDAKMVTEAMEQFPLGKIDLLFIENVGNLVCPASFSIGEDIKVSVVSLAEGADKPAKYPKAIQVSSAMVLTKTDLLPYIDCDMERMERDALTIHPEIEVFRISAKTGEGVSRFLRWIEKAAHSRSASA